MRMAGGSSWQATSAMPHTLVAALHLRDAAGLDVGPGFLPGPSASAPDESDFRPSRSGGSARLYGYLAGRKQVEGAGSGDAAGRGQDRGSREGGGQERGAQEGGGREPGRGPDAGGEGGREGGPPSRRDLSRFTAMGRGVTRDPFIPPLDPQVPYDAALVPFATARAAEAWRAWWGTLLNRHPEFRGVPPLVPDPFPELPVDLRALIGIGLPEADAWYDERQREEQGDLRRVHSDQAGVAAERHRAVPNQVPVGDVVRRFEREQDRKAAPFDLLISILPVSGPWAARVRRDHVLISRTLAEDTAGCAAFLTPVVRDLAD